MLTDGTARELNAMTRDADATRHISWIPLGGIFWSDELPLTPQPSGKGIPRVPRISNFPEDDRKQLVRLFGLRVKLWKRQSFTEQEERFWDAIRNQVPSWVFFSRVSVGIEDLQVQEEVERESNIAFESLFSGARETHISEEDGLQCWSATFDLPENKAGMKKSMLARLFRMWR